MPTNIGVSRIDGKELAPSIPTPGKPGRVVRFTRHRHPGAWATAQTFLAFSGPKLSPRCRLLLDWLLTNADRDGLCWQKITGELGAQMGLSEKRGAHRACIAAKRIQLLARKLRALGLLDWFVIPNKGRYPKRDAATGKALMGKGELARFGGRVWVVKWAQFGVHFGGPAVGTDRSCVIQVGSHMCDPNRITLQISLGSLREPLKRDPAAPRDPPAPSRPPRPPDREALPDRAVASLPPLPATPPASEDRAMAEARDAASSPAPRDEAKSSKGKRPAPKSRPPAPAPAWLQSMQERVERKFGERARLTTADALESAPAVPEPPREPPDPRKRE